MVNLAHKTAKRILDLAYGCDSQWVKNIKPHLRTTSELVRSDQSQLWCHAVNWRTNHWAPKGRGAVRPQPFSAKCGCQYRICIQKEAIYMDGPRTRGFDTVLFLATAGPGRSIIRRKPKQSFFSQGASADSVFYLQTGRAKLTVVSERGKEATVTLLAAGDFFGEESMAGLGALRTATATAVGACVVLSIAREQMLRTLHQEHSFSDFFLQFVLTRGIRTQADLVDQLFNSSERRLARTLLLMAEFGKPGEPLTLLPPITQETLAEMIGTTRSRVSFFMNRFRKLGYIDYNGQIRVNKTLLNVVLQDRLPEQNASRPVLVEPPHRPTRTARRTKRM
jgi:CRP/FNR family cyclic AMP-dependent transcriptional regulator